MTTIDHDTGEVLDEQTALTRVNDLLSQIQRVTSAPQAKQYVDYGAALMAAVRRLSTSFETQFAAEELWVRYYWQLGRLLKDLNLRGGDRKSKTHEAFLKPTLADLGIEDSQSTRAQKLADILPHDLDYKIELRRVARQQLTLISLLKPRKTATEEEEDDEEEEEDTQPANWTSVSNEWYTPAVYVEAAREVMGAIDLDPASNATAQEAIGAAQWCGLDHPDPDRCDGLAVTWHGRVWLNPPYGVDAGESSSGVWAARLIDHHDAGVVTEAVLLVNAVTDRKWFQQLWRFPICFTDHRIKFYTPDGTPQQPVNGNALVYLGDNVARFVQVFSQFGAVVSRLQVYDDVVYAEVENAGA